MTDVAAEQAADPPDAAEPATAPAPTTWGPRVLVVAAAASAVWPTTLGPAQLTVGRLLLVALTVAVLVDLVPTRARGLRPVGPAVRVAVALGALLLWGAISAAAWGSFAAGSVQGFAELVLLTVLTAAVGLYAVPRMAVCAVAAATLGVLAGGLLAAVGLRNLHAAVFAPSESADRLEGVYGNPNFLGLALALALPAAAAGVVRLRGWRRWASLATGLALAGLLVATFSRGSLMAAAVGVPVAAAVAYGRRPSWKVAVAIAVAVPVVAIGIVLSPLYQSARLRADFGTDTVTTALTIDRSGWWPGRAGAVKVPGAVLSNPPDSTALRVAADRAGQGVSIDLGQPFGTSRAGWRFTVSRQAGDDPLDVHWLVTTPSGERIREGVAPATGRPRTVEARFPAELGDHFALQAWTGQPGTFTLDRVALYERRPGSIGGYRPLPTRLLGAAPDRLHQAESDYEESRWTALRLAGDAFLAHPLEGLGWNGFPAYAARHDRYGAIPTHNTYAQVLAELGLVGVLALLAVLGTLGLAAWRGRPPRLLHGALAGTLAAGAIGFLFINGLSLPGAVMPLMLAMGLTAAWGGVAPPSAAGTAARPRGS